MASSLRPASRRARTSALKPPPFPSRAPAETATAPTTAIGELDGTTVRVDTYAAGWGWFVDPTPADAGEFTRAGDGRLMAGAGSPAAGRMDLLTVLVHELRHALGLEHDDAAMVGELVAGIRLLPTPVGPEGPGRQPSGGRAHVRTGGGNGPPALRRTSSTPTLAALHWGVANQSAASSSPAQRGDRPPGDAFRAGSTRSLMSQSVTSVAMWADGLSSVERVINSTSPRCSAVVSNGLRSRSASAGRSARCYFADRSPERSQGTALHLSFSHGSEPRDPK